MKRSTIILGLLLICASVFSNTNTTRLAFLESYKHVKSIQLPLRTPPSINSGQSFSIPENPTSGDVIGIIDTTTAGGTNGTVTWTLSNNPNPNGTGGNAFEISPSGELKVLDAGDFDYETSTSLQVTVTVSDDDGSSTPQSVTVNITPVSEFTPVVTASQSFTIAENLSNGQVVGTVVATDDDAGTTFKDWTITQNYILQGNTNNAFSINPNTGEITVNDSGNLDYEQVKTITISVNVTDEGNRTSGSVPLTINLTNKNDKIGRAHV